MVKVYDTPEELKKFFYPLCRSRVHELNLEELPSSISASDLNSVEKVDRLIKAFSEAVPKQSGSKKLHYSNFIFRLKARKHYLIYGIDDSSIADLPSANSKWWTGFAQRQQKYNNEPKTISPESHPFGEQGSELSVSAMANFLEREVIQLHIEFDSYMEVDRLVRGEQSDLRAAKIFNDWLQSDKNSARISDEKISEGRTNGAFTRWKPITKWYREEITKFEYLLKLLTEFDWKKAKPNEIKKILEDESLTWSVGGAEARSGKDNKIIINNLIKNNENAKFILNKIDKAKLRRIKKLFYFYHFLPKELIVDIHKGYMWMVLDTDSRTKGKLQRFFWKSGEDWQKDEKKVKEFEAILNDAFLDSKGTVGAKEKDQEFLIKENNLRLAIIAGELIEKYLDLQVEKEQKKRIQEAWNHYKNHILEETQTEQDYYQAWEQVVDRLMQERERERVKHKKTKRTEPTVEDEDHYSENEKDQPTTPSNSLGKEEEDKNNSSPKVDDSPSCAPKYDSDLVNDLAEIERLKNEDQTYQKPKDEVVQKKDQLAKNEPVSYGKIMAKILEQKITELQIQISKLPSTISEKLTKLKEGHFTNYIEVRQVEEEVSEAVSEKVANFQLDNLINNAKRVLKEGANNLKSQLEKVKKDLCNFKLSKNIFWQKAYQNQAFQVEQLIKNLESYSTSLQPTKSTFSLPFQIIIPIFLAAVLVTLVVTIVKKKKTTKVKL